MTLAEATLDSGRSQLHVHEVGGNNRGPDVEKYQKIVGLSPGEAWCAAFVSWSVLTGAVMYHDVVGPPQFRASGGALRLLDKNHHLRIAHPREAQGPYIFVLDHGQGRGHCGLGEAWVEADGDRMRTIEGNTNAGPSAPASDREGGGVYRRLDRKISDCLGFLRIG